MSHQAFVDQIVQRIVKAYDPLIIYLLGKEEWDLDEDYEEVDLRIIVQSSAINNQTEGPIGQVSIDRAQAGYEALKDLPGEKFILVFTLDEFDSLRKKGDLTYVFATTHGTKIYTK